uniref:Uncharacterized protein n=1 Tax=Pithovirus LCPAC403 TaxID=2506596 RepID=A0A481ZB35_9VIRU|nr:MAG: uncharacterized protein LCPAC403_02770 [Pithovirus LCPAC403]
MEHFKTGIYAVNNSSIPWYKIPTVTKPKRKVKKKPIVYPLFIECEDAVEDVFWKDMFSKMSINKFPKGFGFRVVDQKLVCHDRSNTQYVSLTGSISEIASKCMQFFRERANILSEIDNLEIQQSYLIIQQEVNKPREWKDIKLRKGERRAAIIQYVSELARKFNLSDKEFDDLLTLININFHLGRIGNNDIYYKDGCITSIGGIVRENGKFKLEDSYSEKKCKFREKDILSINLTRQPQCSISNRWAKIVASKNGVSKQKIIKQITEARTITE